MPLTATEMRLLEEACGNPDNANARDLVNAFGVTDASAILAQLAALPATIRVDLMEQVRKAIESQRTFRPKT